jgi:disulfide bond formation protein DsbB
MIRTYGLYAVWVIAMIATFGSLYLNEVQFVPPCHLCWYQKICMYPLAMIAGIAAWRGNFGIAVYLIPQALLGFVLAALQIVIQSFSIQGFFPIRFCTPGPDCSNVIAFGIEIFSLSILSVLGFFVINVLLFIIYFKDKKGVSYEKQ